MELNESNMILLLIFSISCYLSVLVCSRLICKTLADSIVRTCTVSKQSSGNVCVLKNQAGAHV
jgi:hypothetical protein